MSSQVSKVHTACVLCVLFDIQPTLLAFREDKIRNEGKETLTLCSLLHKHTSGFIPGNGTQ